MILVLFNKYDASYLKTALGHIKGNSGFNDIFTLSKIFPRHFVLPLGRRPSNGNMLGKFETEFVKIWQIDFSKSRTHKIEFIVMCITYIRAAKHYIDH